MHLSRVPSRIALGAALGALALAIAARPARAQPEAPGHAGRAVVLIALPAVDSATKGELREALLAQFALLPADPHIEDEPETAAGTSLGQRMSNAQARGSELGAIAVFWIEPQPDGRWLLHMMDSESERILVRAVDARAERRAAAIEAVAVMVRESTRALIEGVPVMEAGPASGAPEVELETRPTTGVVIEREAAVVETGTSSKPESESDTGTSSSAETEKAPEQRPVRLWVGYHGDEFADGRGLQSGVAVGGGWFGLAPFHFSATFAFAPAVEVKTPEIRFEIQRLPVGLSGGFRYRLGVVAFDLELGGIVEFLRGSDPENRRAVQGFVLEDASPTREELFGLTGRVRVEVFAAQSISLFGTFGLDFFFNEFEYVTRDFENPSTQVTLLQVVPVRPVAELGLAFYP